MDDLYLCPDCLALHAEPLDAVLGHVVRCFACAVAAELDALPLRQQSQDVSVNHELLPRAA